MNPRAFRDLALTLASAAKPTPAELRTAVSRAYYGTYHVAVIMLRRMGASHVGGWQAHQAIPEALRYTGDEKVRDAARELVDLRKMRWEADYDMNAAAVEDHRTAQKLVARSRQAIKKLDEFEADPARFLEARIKIRNWAGSAEGAAKGFRLL